MDQVVGQALAAFRKLQAAQEAERSIHDAAALDAPVAA
jgi:hypothetical protein